MLATTAQRMNNAALYAYCRTKVEWNHLKARARRLPKEAASRIAGGTRAQGFLEYLILAILVLAIAAAVAMLFRAIKNRYEATTNTVETLPEPGPIEAP